MGSHLTDRLLAEGHRVTAIDNLITGNAANIGHLAGNENYKFIKHNVSNFIFLPEEKIDYVFHFASPASPIDYLELPIPTLKVGALGTHNTLGLAKDKKAAFILASTSEVYGDPLVHPQKEDYWGNVNRRGACVYDEVCRSSNEWIPPPSPGHSKSCVPSRPTAMMRLKVAAPCRLSASIGRHQCGDGSQTRCFVTYPI